MLEKELIEQCAPTLASLKPASLFSCPITCREELKASLDYWNRTLSGKGVELALLRISNGRALIYAFRMDKLRRELEDPGTREFLRNCGYEDLEPAAALRKLSEKLREEQDFPHEIGLFLGYPLEDVRGFVENHGRNCRCCGIWKVYHDEPGARKTFELFRKCSEIYGKLYRSGRRSVLQLTVSA